MNLKFKKNKLNTFSSSKSCAVAYGLGDHTRRSRGKCIVSRINFDEMSLADTSLLK